MHWLNYNTGITATFKGNFVLFASRVWSSCDEAREVLTCCLVQAASTKVGGCCSEGMHWLTYNTRITATFEWNFVLFASRVRHLPSSSEKAGEVLTCCLEWAASIKQGGCCSKSSTLAIYSHGEDKNFRVKFCIICFTNTVFMEPLQISKGGPDLLFCLGSLY